MRFVSLLALLALASRAASLSLGLSGRVARRAAPAMLADDSWSSLESQIRSQLRSVCAGVSLGAAKPLLSNKPKAWVLIFNEGSANEGVYTLQGKEPDEASTLTYVLAFEQLGDAVRFAALLQAQGLSAPAPTERTAEQLVEFCGKAGLRLGVMPAGALPLSSESVESGRLRLEACFGLRSPPPGSGPQLEP